MIQVNFLTKTDLITIPVERIVTSNSTNSVYIEFNSDSFARDSERMLKQHGFKTEHTEGTIRVLNFNEFDLIIPN